MYIGAHFKTQCVPQSLLTQGTPCLQSWHRNVGAIKWGSALFRGACKGDMSREALQRKT